MRKNELEHIITKLLISHYEINLRMIAHEAGLKAEDSADRRAIQRVLSRLIKQGTLRSQGRARAISYTRIHKIENIPASAALVREDESFSYMKLSNMAIKLLQYISQPLHFRTSIGYQLEFLRKYQPNQTFYLTEAQRLELQAVGKVESVIRPAGTYARNILNRLLIDLSWNSSRLEGNTYSLLETKRLIELGENAEGKNASEAQMILNHKEAIEYVVEMADEPLVSFHEICSIHALLSENLLGDPRAQGRIRHIAVDITGTAYMPLDNPHILKEYLDLFIEKMNRIEDPFEQSLFSLVHLSYLQAFEDVNKRTARLVANIPMIKANLKPLSFVDVKQKDYTLALIGIYEKNDISLMRDLYLWAYQRSAQRYSAQQQNMGEPNILKLQYRKEIQEIIHNIIVTKVKGKQVVEALQAFIAKLNVSPHDATRLFEILEVEIISLHEGNIARFKIRPSEFEEWKILQK